MTVDGRCDSSPDAKECNFEQFNANSPLRYVDLFHRQPSHPEEGMDLPDGGKISCASNDAVYVIEDVTCPSGFTAYEGDESSDICVFPCLSFLFTSEQIDTTFAVYVATGFLGLCTNLFLVVTYAMSRKKKGQGLPPFVVMCASCGLLFNLIDTVPTALFKLDLPCNDNCRDEFCHGDGAICKLGQPSEYLLLAVFCILLDTLLQLYTKTTLSWAPHKCRQLSKVYTAASATLVTVCVILCLLADTDLLNSGSTEYRQLIVARDAFNCGPRFSSSTQEFVLLTLPFMAVCLTLVVVTVSMILNVLWIVHKNGSRFFSISFP
jgi:hypothetical protein